MLSLGTFEHKDPVLAMTSVKFTKTSVKFTSSMIKPSGGSRMTGARLGG